MTRCHFVQLLVAVVSMMLFAACKNTASNAPTTSHAVIPDPRRFDEEIDIIKKKTFDTQRDRIVFTGSSSIRFWKNLSEYYPDHQIINSGFGGSEMSDLLFYLEHTVLRFKPSKIFIYEGDNDIHAGRPIPVILENTKKVIETVENKFPDCQIILISAKPSIARWHLKTEYEALNKAFKKITSQKANRHFANIWKMMLNENGEVEPSIFIADGLHMNIAGYDRWDKVIRPLIEQ